MSNKRWSIQNYTLQHTNKVKQFQAKSFQRLLILSNTILSHCKYRKTKIKSISFTLSITNILGQENTTIKNQPLIKVYDDGSTEKR